jgi:hypothetical protein
MGNVQGMSERPFSEQVAWLRHAQASREASRARHGAPVISKRAIAQLLVSEAPAWVTEEAKRGYLAGL